MNKSAKTDYPVHDWIAQRWSPRAFAEKPVPRDVVARLFEAARWAPSCYNEQPWAFLVALKEDPEEYQRALRCLVEFNQSWVKTAPVVVLTLARKTFRHNGKPNAHAWHDVGLAVANLTYQAAAEGLHVHQMAGIEPDVVRRTYALPEDVDPVTAVAVGYLGDPSVPPEGLAAKEIEERTRRPQSDFVFASAWGRPWKP
jgi:nitroreductase